MNAMEASTNARTGWREKLSTWTVHMLKWPTIDQMTEDIDVVPLASHSVNVSGT